MATEIYEITSPWTSGSPLEISGTAFTAQQGTLYLVFPDRGLTRQLAVSSWTDTKIVATLPTRFGAGVVVYVVIQGPAGSPYCIRSDYYSTEVDRTPPVPPIRPGTLVTITAEAAANLDIPNNSGSPSLIGTCTGWNVSAGKYIVEWPGVELASQIDPEYVLALGNLTIDRGLALGTIPDDTPRR